MLALALKDPLELAEPVPVGAGADALAGYGIAGENNGAALAGAAAGVVPAADIGGADAAGGADIGAPVVARGAEAGGLLAMAAAGAAAALAMPA